MQAILTDKAPQAIGVYSQAIKTKEWLFLSGQIGLDPKTMQLVNADFEAQVKQIFENITAVLNEAGVAMHSIVKLTVFLKDLNDFQKLNEMMRHYFVEPYPARAVVEVSRLPKDATIEIEALATLER